MEKQSLIWFVIFFSVSEMVFGGNVYLDKNVWVAKVEGDTDHVKQLAAKHGFDVVSQVDVDDEMYVLKRRRFSSVGRDIQDMKNEDEVNWIEKQTPLKRSKRQIFSWFDSRYSHEFNDALWNRQWYLQDYRTKDTQTVMDMNVVPCYREGITGKGVRVAVVDDGLEKNHIDLRNNYDPQISFNFVENNTDPTPDSSDSSHGTQCAGVIAMVPNNTHCGVGVAFNSHIGGIRLLDGEVNDLMESKALSYAQDKVDIYSCSWGPEDSGEPMEGPQRQAQAALLSGIMNVSE